MSAPEKSASPASEQPRGNFAGFSRYFQHDIVSGLLVFLIALPLCLGISLASGFPPIAGIFTAIIGAILTTFLSNSEMTIKGPAAGLIVIAIGCINDFGGDGMLNGWTEADLGAYKATLAVGVAAAVLQILFGLLRGGVLGEFFPTTVVHGMLAAIGVIIIAKQIPVALGVSAGGEPLEMLLHIPKYIEHANPAIALIGMISVLIMFLWPLVGKLVGGLRLIPAPMVVLVVSIPMGMAFQLMTDHTYTFNGHEYALNESFLVKMPEKMFGMFADITTPNFAVLSEAKAWKWIAMFFIIGSLESLLSAKAVDLLDPYKRKSDMNKDMLAVGVANLCASLVGGLPMISEIVRSRANIDNGAKTRFANFWHGLFLLACVALIPMYLHLIPLAALAAMLVFTGYRLAHPREFLHVYHIGREQLFLFVVTILAVLATDLLIGVAAGIVLKLVIHYVNGLSPGSTFQPKLSCSQIDEQNAQLKIQGAAVFSNWIAIRTQADKQGLKAGCNLTIDLSEARLVDHSVMAKLEELSNDFTQQSLQLEVKGLEGMQPFSSHPQAARVRKSS